MAARPMCRSIAWSSDTVKLALTATANGDFLCNTAGATNFRVRATAFVSGVTSVWVNLSAARRPGRHRLAARHGGREWARTPPFTPPSRSPPRPPRPTSLSFRAPLRRRWPSARSSSRVLLAAAESPSSLDHSPLGRRYRRHVRRRDTGAMRTATIRVRRPQVSAYTVNPTGLGTAVGHGIRQSHPWRSTRRRSAPALIGLSLDYGDRRRQISGAARRRATSWRSISTPPRSPRSTGTSNSPRMQ